MRYFDPFKREWTQGDPNESVTILGRLHKSHFISLDQRLAGERFASLHRKAVGLSLNAKGISFDDSRGFYGLEEGDLEQERRKQIEFAWAEARSAVKACSRKALDAALSVCCYERPTEHVEDLWLALALLRKHFGLGEERAAA